MGFFSWIILGGLAGWIASIVTGDNKSMGIVANIVVGVIGALIGGYIITLFGGVGVTGFNIWSLAVAILGSVVLLALVKALRGGKKF